jgi:hypothetical protein
MTGFSAMRADSRRRRRAFGAVAVLALVAVGTAAAVTSRATVAPSNASLPTIGGSVAVGSTLTANPGTWNGSTPLTFQHQWQICNENGAACHDISGATASTYQLKADDAGNTLRVRVIASNPDGSASALSPASARVAAAAPGPVNTVAPSISGNATTGSTLTASPGTWTGTAPITYAYQWTVCDGNGNACHDISGATANTYVLKRDDAGNTVRVRVAARNNAGTTNATSAASARIATGGGSGGGGAAAGCPAVAAGAAIPIADLGAPARLVVSSFQVTSGTLTRSSTSFTARFRVTSTCGTNPVSGALVYATAVPYNQFGIPAEVTTDNAGWAMMTFNARNGYPASPRQQQLTMFVRARKNGEPLLAGISTRRLIAFSLDR